MALIIKILLYLLYMIVKLPSILYVHVLCELITMILISSKFFIFLYDISFGALYRLLPRKAKIIGWILSVIAIIGTVMYSISVAQSSVIITVEANSILRDPLQLLIISAAAKYNVDPDLFSALVKQESANRNDAVSYVGAVGYVQLMAATSETSCGFKVVHPPKKIMEIKSISARRVALVNFYEEVRASDKRHGTVSDERFEDKALDCGAKYIRQQLNSCGNVAMALAAYNAGPTAQGKEACKRIVPYPETAGYVSNIMKDVCSRKGMSYAPKDGEFGCI